MHSVLLTFLELTLFGARREHSADGLHGGSGSRSGLLYHRGGGHPGRLLFGVVRMDRREVIRMGSFHLYLVLILFFRIKRIIHRFDLEREETMLKSCRLCARRVIYDRQSELSLENNILKVVFIVTGIVCGVSRGI